MQNKEVTLKGTLWQLEDLNELERELIRNIEKLDGEPKQLKQVANLVTNKLGLIRALINAERYLEDNCGVKFVREVV